jgi:hypothetical protein
LGLTGTNEDALRDALADYPMFNFVEGRDLPSTFENLEVIEFAHEKIAEPRQADFHGFLCTIISALSDLKAEMLSANKINRIFDRNGIAFQ